eukprot:TRINITY_DN17199_c0_g1_i1.p1 TRINITY_DN17199_c0_g1~~TRINITY_DN17199_c0_g1_i1.p1  ORF type:complete len:519 (-),score=46.12 TRINITY_DN17199_c0_g1_i1:172-1728(-)
MSDGSVTVGHCIEGLPIGHFVWELLLCAFLASFLLGSLNETTPFELGYVNSEWATSARSVQATFAFGALGNLLSVLIAGWLADRYGRIAVLRPSILLTLSCGVVVQSVHTFPQALFAKFLLGIASGGLVTVLMPLLAELLPTKHRGYYLTIWCCGKPAGSLYALFLSALVPGGGWSNFTLMMMVPSILLYMLTRIDMLPESPRHLYLTGRRDEGFNILLDMYERNGLPFPWAPESIAVTCGNPSSKSCAKTFASSTAAVTAWLCGAIFFVSGAAQCTKIWIPFVMESHGPEVLPATTNLLLNEMISARQGTTNVWPKQSQISLLSFFLDPLALPQADRRIALVLAQGYFMEILGVILCANLTMYVNRKTMIQWSLFLATFVSLIAIAAEQRRWFLLAGPLIGVQLVAQSSGLNFLQVFACERFPTSSRAFTVGLVMFSGQLARFIIPGLAGMLSLHNSGASITIFFGCLYSLGWVASIALPLPSSRQKPLHDIEETKRHGKDASARTRKQPTTTYQTV